jgi:hypothetical protein
MPHRLTQWRWRLITVFKKEIDNRHGHGPGLVSTTVARGDRARTRPAVLAEARQARPRRALAHAGKTGASLPSQAVFGRTESS